MISSERAEEILRCFDFDEPGRVRSALGELSQRLTDQELKELLDHADLTGEQRQRIAEELRSRAEREEKDEKTLGRSANKSLLTRDKNWGVGRLTQKRNPIATVHERGLESVCRQ